MPGMSVGGSRRARVTAVLGMHRSGTSLVAGVLHLLGVSLGPEERLMPAKADNPRGFWEYEPFTEINDAILEAFGGSWDEPPELRFGWERDPRLRGLRRKARAAIRADFPRRAPWAFKDPRTSLTLPFWHRLAGRMRHMVCVRNPVDVAASLEARNGFPMARGARLWLRYTSAALQHTAGRPRLLVFYEDVIEAWRPEVRRLARFLGLEVPPGADPAIEDFVGADLRHHATPLEDVASDARIPPPVRTAYLALREADPAAVDELAAAVIRRADRGTDR
jgi:hypothetical protein